MARLFTCGFEENNFTATMWLSSGGTTTPSLVTTTPHSGTYRMDSASAAGASRIVKTTATSYTSGELFTRFYLSVNDATPAANTSVFFCQNAANTATSVAVYLLTTGKIRLNNQISGATSDGTTVISADTWYRIEVRQLISDTVGEHELRLYLGDSTSALDTLSLTSQDTLPTNVASFLYGKGATGAAGEIYSFDDIAINDTTGTFQTSWCGPGKIVLLEPDTDDTVAWTDATGTGTGNAGEVDELPGAPDDDTSYVTSSTANQEDRYNLTAMPAEVTSDATINVVDVYARIRGENTTSTRQCRVLLWDEAAAQTNGPTTALNDSTAYAVMSTADHLVFDAATAATTKADVDSFDAGAEPITAHATRLTALWVNVEWLEATAVAGAGPLFDRVYRGMRA